MKEFSYTLRFLVFIGILFPFWAADICYLGCMILRLLPSLPNSIINFLWYFADAYIPISIILILIALIFDSIIAIHNKYNR